MLHRFPKSYTRAGFVRAKRAKFDVRTATKDATQLRALEAGLERAKTNLERLKLKLGGCKPSAGSAALREQLAAATSVVEEKTAIVARLRERAKHSSKAAQSALGSRQTKDTVAQYATQKQQQQPRRTATGKKTAPHLATRASSSTTTTTASGRVVKRPRRKVQSDDDDDDDDDDDADDDDDDDDGDTGASSQSASDTDGTSDGGTGSDSGGSSDLEDNAGEPAKPQQPALQPGTRSERERDRRRALPSFTDDEKEEEERLAKERESSSMVFGDTVWISPLRPEVHSASRSQRNAKKQRT